MQKNSRNSQKHGTTCDREQCPLIAGSKPVVISHLQSHVTLIFGNDEAIPFVVAYFPAKVPLVRSISSTPPPTLLSLGCALTV
jgi:hypothetical protein